MNFLKSVIAVCTDAEWHDFLDDFIIIWKLIALNVLAEL